MTKYLDIYELGEVLGRSPDSIRRKLKSNPRGVPPTMYIPGTRMLRWRPAEVEAWLEEQEIGKGLESDTFPVSRQGRHGRLNFP